MIAELHSHVLLHDCAGWIEVVTVRASPTHLLVALQNNASVQRSKVRKADAAVRQSQQADAVVGTPVQRVEGDQEPHCRGALVRLASSLTSRVRWYT